MGNKDIKNYKKEIFAIQSILFDLGYDKIKVSGYIEYINFEFRVFNGNVFDCRCYDEIKNALQEFNVIYDLWYNSEDMKFFCVIKLYNDYVDVNNVL